MDTQQPDAADCPARSASEEKYRGERGAQLSRRTVLKLGIGALGLSGTTFGVIEALARVPQRVAHAAPPHLPDIQFDINNYIGPAHTLDESGNIAPQGVLFRFGPVYTLFLTAKLKHIPGLHEQQTLVRALDTIEAVYPFSPSGIFTFVSYGLPYFHRLPGDLVARSMPRLLANQNRFALEEAVPSPTDISHLNPRITKRRFRVPVEIEQNDLLFTLRSDSLDTIKNVVDWLQGTTTTLNNHAMQASGLNTMLTFTSSRLQFVQVGLPRKIANAHLLPYAQRVNPHSPMWMGFADQQVDGSGPAAITTFQGNASARFTTTRQGDYFFNGSIQHLSHDIQDLEQFYASDEPYTERCQYIFRSNPMPSVGNKDQFINGGGPGFFDNIYHGPGDALANAKAIDTYHGEHRMGHITALQRSSRASDGTPIHIRMDGPGFDALDVPDGSSQPKLHFTIFVPTADFFATMRKNGAALDLVEKYNVNDDDNGLERFITATRRQNFLVPPRAHRAFPLLELI